MTYYNHPLFKEVDYGDVSFCLHCKRFIRTEEAVAIGWACPECGPDLTSAWDIRPNFVGVQYCDAKAALDAGE